MEAWNAHVNFWDPKVVARRPQAPKFTQNGCQTYSKCVPKSMLLRIWDSFSMNHAMLSGKYETHPRTKQPNSMWDLPNKQKACHAKLAKNMSAVELTHLAFFTQMTIKRIVARKHIPEPLNKFLSLDKHASCFKMLLQQSSPCVLFCSIAAFLTLQPNSTHWFFQMMRIIQILYMSSCFYAL